MGTAENEGPRYGACQVMRTYCTVTEERMAASGVQSRTRICGAGKILLLALSTSLVMISAAQELPSVDNPYEEVLGDQERPAIFDPEHYGMTLVDDPAIFLSLLIEADRCPPGGKGTKGIPCAAISYAPEGTRDEFYQRSLRPIFKVERSGRVWTFLDGQLALVPADFLLSVSDLSDASGLERGSYVPTALVGYKETEVRCRRDEPCVEDFFFTFKSSILTTGCLEKIWNRRGGPTGSGEQSRCVYRDIRN